MMVWKMIFLFNWVVLCSMLIFRGVVSMFSPRLCQEHPLFVIPGLEFYETSPRSLCWQVWGLREEDGWPICCDGIWLKWMVNIGKLFKLGDGFNLSWIFTLIWLYIWYLSNGWLNHQVVKFHLRKEWTSIHNLTSNVFGKWRFTKIPQAKCE